MLFSVYTALSKWDIEMLHYLQILTSLLFSSGKPNLIPVYMLSQIAGLNIGTLLNWAVNYKKFILFF